MFINIRKLAALDIVFHGPKLILGEFAIGILLPLALGVLCFLRGHAQWQTTLGAYLVLLAINYVPLMAYAIAIVHKGSAKEEAADGLGRDRKRYLSQSLLLLVPLIVPLLAISQELRGQEIGS